jgi:hypothetical protein
LNDTAWLTFRRQANISPLLAKSNTKYRFTASIKHECILIIPGCAIPLFPFALFSDFTLLSLGASDALLFLGVDMDVEGRLRLSTGVEGAGTVSILVRGSSVTGDGALERNSSSIGLSNMISSARSGTTSGGSADLEGRLPAKLAFNVGDIGNPPIRPSEDELEVTELERLEDGLPVVIVDWLSLLVPGALAIPLKDVFERFFPAEEGTPLEVAFPPDVARRWPVTALGSL